MEVYDLGQSKTQSRFMPSFLEKEVKIYKNGDTSVASEVRIGKNTRFVDLCEEIQRKLKMTNIKQLRLFNAEGVEIYEEDMDFISDKSVLYVSRGEDFDANASLGEFEIIKTIGQGGFGKVVLGVHRKTKEKVAIKIVNANMEAEVLKHVKHKNIVKLHQCLLLKNMSIAVIMEYLEGGELGQYLKTKGKFDEEEAKFFFKQLADAINYCHHEKLIHRDLKLENILLASADSKLIKVVDFGISGICSNLNADAQEAGTLRYMAPEIFLGKMKTVHPALDIWSMGCILYYMLHGNLPFNGKTKKEIIDKIKVGNYTIAPEIEKTLSRECLDILRKMLTVEAKERITITDIVNHPWLLDTKMTEEEKHAHPETVPTEPSEETPKSTIFQLAAKRPSVGANKLDTRNKRSVSKGKASPTAFLNHSMTTEYKKETPAIARKKLSQFSVNEDKNISNKQTLKSRLAVVGPGSFIPKIHKRE